MDTRPRWTSLARPAAIICCLLVGTPTLAADGIPKPLNGIVYSGSKRSIEIVTLNGVAFDSVRAIRPPKARLRDRNRLFPS